MATIQVDVRRLQAEFPTEFERAYWEWAETWPDYGWWNCVVDRFVEDLEAKGVLVEYRPGRHPTPSVYFSLGYSQGDYASFEGTVTLDEWFAAVGLAETYPMLAASLEAYGATAKISTRNWGGSYVSDFDYEPGAAAPPKDSMFADMDPEVWEEVVREQYEAADLEKELEDWVKEQCQDLYIALRDEYEYLTSEEQFIEYCEANGEMFEVEVDDEEVESTAKA